MLSVELEGLDQSAQRERIQDWFERPFLDLLMQAQTVQRMHFEPNLVQISTLHSIKTGRCPEKCDYCSQSAHFETELEPVKQEPIESVIQRAKEAKHSGSGRFCMGAAWKNPHERDMPYVTRLVREVKALGLETCMTLGSLSTDQVERLKEAGLDYYNHNIDTSKDFYAEVVHTRSFEERIDTLKRVQDGGIKVCSGGILGMGESRADRVDFLLALASLPRPPESVPINRLVPIKGTPLGDKAAQGVLAELPVLEWIRTVAVARLCFPASYIRLSAGREALTDAEQALAFMAGANSFFFGERLLTSENRKQSSDTELMQRLGLVSESAQGYAEQLSGAPPHIHCVQV